MGIDFESMGAMPTKKTYKSEALLLNFAPFFGI